MHLGLDLGTSALKGLVVDDDDRVLAEASAPLSVSRPAPGWSEQSPSDWIAAAEAVLDALAAQVEMRAIRGVGLSGQMHGAVCLDASDQVLRPAILWNDTRAGAEAARLDADPAFRAVTGNIVFPGFTAPKLAWLSAQDPALFARIARVLLPKDYLRLWLTGEAVSEMSDASGTAWLDVGGRRWDGGLLAACGLEPAHMPRLVEGAEVSAQLRSEIAGRWGFAPGTPVAGGAGDNAAAAVGTGVVRPGSGFVSLGTSGVLFAATEGFAPAPETAVHAFAHALPGMWHQMGVILAATDAVNWYAGLLGVAPATLTAELGETVHPPGRALFLPYLGGERTPLNDAHIRGGFAGLEHATDRAAATRAVLEGVAFALRDCRDALAATGTRLQSLVATGGGSASPYWLALLAAALDCEITLPAAGPHGAALGAARLARMAAEKAGPETAQPPPIARRFAPEPALAAACTEAHARWKTAQRLLGDLP